MVLVLLFLTFYCFYEFGFVVIEVILKIY